MPAGVVANRRSSFPGAAPAPSYSNDLECAGLFDELPQPLHVRRAARPARIVGPAVDVFLRPTVVNRAEVRHSVEHRIVRLSVSKLPDIRHRLDSLDQGTPLRV